MRAKESEEQQALIQWTELQMNKYPELELLFHIPNGGKRHIAVAKKLKAEGVKSGVPDLCLPVPKREFHGMYIEMKVPGNSPTKNQKVWIKNLKAQGYYVVVCYGWEKAAEELKKYLAW